MKKDAVVLIYGSGGHKEQMARLYANLAGVLKKKIMFIGLCEKSHELNELSFNFTVPPAREKFSLLKTLFNIPFAIFQTFYFFVLMVCKYNIKLIISTGPGLTVLPVLLGKLFRVKTIFIESWSRFYTASLTGKIMYHLADEFYIQNKSLQKTYPKAKYCGLL